MKSSSVSIETIQGNMAARSFEPSGQYNHLGEHTLWEGDPELQDNGSLLIDKLITRTYKWEEFKRNKDQYETEQQGKTTKISLEQTK